MRSSNGVFKSDTPHFFKVILRNDFIGDDILRIPSKFAREHGSSLSDRVCLQVPGGSTWDVGLQRDNQGLLLLRDGWEEFMRYYHIDHGHFILFRYEGDSRFHITIFDRTACEIEYPLKSLSDEEDSVVEISMEECIQSAGSGKRQSRPPKKPTRVDTHEMNGIDNGHLNFNVHVKTTAVKAAQDSGALQRASSFKCRNLSSLVVIQRAYVSPRYTMYLSRKFLTACIPDMGDSFDMKLCTSGKKKWTIKCGIHNPSGRLMIYHGWRKFAVDNNLRVGHVCVFEFLGGADAMFRVTIFGDKGVVRHGGAFRLYGSHLLQRSSPRVAGVWR